jgi:hypothetical protein
LAAQPATAKVTRTIAVRSLLPLNPDNPIMVFSFPCLLY